MNQPKPNRFERNYGREVEELDPMDADAFYAILEKYIDLTFREDWPIAREVNELLSVEEQEALLKELSTLNYYENE